MQICFDLEVYMHLSAIFTNGGLFPEKVFHYDLVQI